MRAKAGRVGGWIAIGMCAFMQAAAAQTAASAPCVEVTVNGERSPSFECLTQKLRPAETSPRDAATGVVMGSEDITRRPSNQLGLYNRAATEHRMGNTFGTSVYPQRPAMQGPAVPVIPRP